MPTLARPWMRLLIAFIGVTALAVLAWRLTGSFIPDDATEALLFQNALLLVVLGSALLEQTHTTPAEAFVNALTALITLMPVYATADSAAWWLIASYLLIVLLAAALCIATQASPGSDAPSSAARAFYRVATTMGRARIVFSVVFLGSIAFFVDGPSALTLSLVIFWGFFMAIWPLGLPQLLAQLRPRSGDSREVVGIIDRVDSPGVVRVSLSVGDRWFWGISDPVLVHLNDKTSRWGLPIVSEERTDGRWGTVLLSDTEAAEGSWLRAGVVERPSTLTEAPSSKELLAGATGIAEPELVGTVREKSTVSSLEVEALPDSTLEVGHVVVVRTRDGLVYYQVTHAVTAEEPFPGLHFGSHIFAAQQVGILDETRVFRRYPWLPPMNSPVLRPPSDAGDAATRSPDSRLVLGDIAGTELSLTGHFVEKLDSHTAILGVTGSGKTELAFDLIRHAARHGVKVVCIDLTAQYADRLRDLSPEDLSISEELATDLGLKLFDVETGKFGAPDEKKALEEFAVRIRSDVLSRLLEFVGSPDSKVGLIELREISNTKATLWITEMFLTALLKIAREGRLNGERVLVVVEEAHTVMPETSSVGLGDFDSKGTVSKIAQIALQGRKYGVGLLVVAQRTATVSKTVLTQCNTVISFSCIDDTSINFLRNVFGSSVANALPSLPRLRAVAHGDWINSEAPVTFEIPFDAVKAEHKTWRPSPQLGQRDDQRPRRPQTQDPPF